MLRKFKRKEESPISLCVVPQYHQGKEGKVLSESDEEKAAQKHKLLCLEGQSIGVPGKSCCLQRSRSRKEGKDPVSYRARSAQRGRDLWPFVRKKRRPTERGPSISRRPDWERKGALFLTFVQSTQHERERSCPTLASFVGAPTERDTIVFAPDSGRPRGKESSYTKR